MDSFTYHLAYRLGKLFLKPFMKLTGLPIDEHRPRLDNLPEDEFIFLLPSFRALDVLAIETFFAKENIPLKSIEAVPSLDDRSVSEFFSELEEKTKNAESVFVVPVSAFWGRMPKKQSTLFQTFAADNWSVVSGIRRLITVLTQPRHIYCYIGQKIPLDKRLFKYSIVQQRGFLTKCAMKLTEQKTALIGPDLSHQRIMIDKVMNNSRLQQFLMDADIHQRKKLEKTAENYLREIASNYSYPVVRFFDHFLSWLWEKLYQGVDVQGLQRLQEVAEGHELIYVPCHRSHMDYLLLSYVIYKQGLMPPHIASGINLNMPVVGRLLRGAGAFFIRRQFKDNLLYKQVLEAYLQTMCEEGFSIEYFIEGGRSRTGLLLQPKPGMLTMTLRASMGHRGRPIVFVPVYIGYEKLFESHSYIKELHGGRKKKETLQGLIKTRKKLKQSYGKVHLTIGEPFALSHVYDPEVIRSEQEFRECVTYLGTKILTHINREVALTPLNILATCLLASPRYALLADQLSGHMDFLKALPVAPYNNAYVAGDLGFDDFLDKAQALKLIDLADADGAKIVVLSEEGQSSSTFLRNNTLHVFLLSSLVATIIVNSQKISNKRLKAICLKLYPFLKAELFLAWELADVEKVVDETLEVFLAHSVIVKKHYGYQLPETDQSPHLVLLAQVAAANIQRFFMTAELICQTKEQPLNQEELAQTVALVSKRFAMLHPCHAPDFLDKKLFQGFIHQLTQYELVETNENKGLVATKDLNLSRDYGKYLLSAANRSTIGEMIKAVLDVGV